MELSTFRQGTKRSRAEMSYNPRQKKAMAISSKIRAQYPYKEFGTAYIKRGSQRSLEAFGPSYKEASPSQRAERKGLGFVGRGKYSDWRRVQRGVQTFGRSSIGKALSSRVVGAISGQGMYSGSGLYTGQGEYVGNDMIATGNTIPDFNPRADESGAVVLSKKEYLGSLYAPATGNAFSIQSFSLNPGLEKTFPWLSQIAQNYDEYTLRQCIVTFRSTTTDIGSTSNGQCGTVIMATNYNTASAPFSDKAVMMQYIGAMSSKTTESMIHGIECDPSKLSNSEGKYVRSNPVVAGQDLKTYDHALFQIAVADSPAGFANQSLGEIWISYTVELRKPKFFVARGLGISRDLYVSSTTTALVFNNVFGAPNFLNAQQNNIGTHMITSGAVAATPLTASNSAPVWVIPANYSGTIRVQLLVEGSTLAASTPWVSQFLLSGNVVAIFDIYGSSVSGGVAPTNAIQSFSTTQATYIIHFKVLPATGGLNNAFQLNIGLTAGTIVQAACDITEYNPGFSYAACNLGTSDAPILVNQSGVIIAV